MLYFAHMRQCKEMRPLSAILVIIILVSAAALAIAETNDAKVTPPQKTENAAIQGTKDALLGWTEIPKSIDQVTKESNNPFTGLTKGTLKGIIRAFSKTVSGTVSAVSSSSNSNVIKPGEQNTGMNK